MRIVLPRVPPDLAKVLAAACRGVAVIAGLFCVAVSSLLVANYVQAAAVKPTENPALTALRERYRSGPGDEALAEEIRQLDLAARRFYFTRQWQTRTAGGFLVGGAAVLLASLRAAGALRRSLPRIPSGGATTEMKEAPRARKALAVAGICLFAAGIVSAVLGGRLLGPAGSAAGRRAGSVLVATTVPGSGHALSPVPDPALPSAQSFSDNWPQFRGPGGNGILSSGSPPVDWDGAQSRNIRWKVEVPLPGRGSPAVWEDRVFLAGAEKSRRELYCWNTATGALLWRAAIPAEASPTNVADTAGYAASSVAVNGQQVFAAFPDGDLVALDFNGKTLWKRALGPLRMNYGYVSSPAVAPGMLVVQIDQEEGGRLLCLDPETGRTLWETKRQVTSSWASPVIAATDRGTLVLAIGDPLLAGYDAAKGTQIWEAGGMKGENAPSPAYADGRAFGSNQLLSLTAVNASTGARLWEIYDDFPDVASPLAIPGGPLIAAMSYGVVSCLDPATGTALWKKEFATGFYASPILAAGRAYCLDRSGVMRIFDADRSMTLIGSPALGEHTEATPAFHGGMIFIRGDTHLFCIGTANGS